MSSYKINYLAAILVSLIFGTSFALTGQQVQSICQCSRAGTFCTTFLNSDPHIKSASDYKSVVVPFLRVVDQKAFSPVYKLSTALEEKYQARRDFAGSAQFEGCDLDLSVVGANLEQALDDAETGYFDDITKQAKEAKLGMQSCDGFIRASEKELKDNIRRAISAFDVFSCIATFVAQQK